MFIQSKKAFYVNFVENDGFSFLCSTLENLEVYLFLKDVVWLSIFQLLVDIFKTMLEDKNFINAIKIASREVSFKNSTEKLLKVWTNILLVTSTDVKLDRDLVKWLLPPEDLENLPMDKINNITNQYEQPEVHFFRYLFVCLKNWLWRWPEEITQFYKWNFFSKSVFIALITTHPNRKAVIQMNQAIVELCSAVQGSSKLKYSPAQFLLESITSHLENIL